MEYDQDTENTEGGIVQRIKESPRTVSALIIILIVAAAIYAFSGDETQQTAQIDEGITVEEGLQEEGEEVAPTEEEGEEEVIEEGAEDAATVATPAPVSQDVITSQNENLPQATKTDEGYVEVAAAGDGLTHLARRATTRYLSENTIEYGVTNEHRIYIEDYIKDQMGSEGLSLGESQTVSYQLLQEAAAAAGNLSASELNNLTQYTHALG